MPTKPKILKRDYAGGSRLFKAEELYLQFSNGEERLYERLISGGHGAVMVVPVTEDNQLILIREYAAGTEDYPWSLPKGAIDKGEDKFTAANRELQEEAGFKAEELIFLKWLSLSPSYMGHGIEVILARGLTPSRLVGDEPEPIEMMTWPLDDITGLIMREDFHEGRAVAALFLAQKFLENEYKYKDENQSE